MISLPELEARQLRLCPACKGKVMIPECIYAPDFANCQIYFIRCTECTFVYTLSVDHHLPLFAPKKDHYAYVTRLVNFYNRDWTAIRKDFS